VLGSAGGVEGFAALLSTTGVAAAVQQPLVGGPGQRQVGITLGDGPISQSVPRSIKPKRAPVKKAVPAKKAVPVKKAVPAKKTSRRRTP